MRALLLSLSAGVLATSSCAAQTDTVIAPITAQDLLESPIVGGGYASKPLAVSPDGNKIAVQVVRRNVEANDYDLQWYVIDVENNEPPKRVADGGDVILNIRQRAINNGSTVDSVAKWSPDGEWIAFAKKAKDEIQIWRAHKSDGRLEQLTSNAANIFGSVAHDPLFEWSADGSRVFYEVARDRAQMMTALATEGDRGFLYDDRFYPDASKTPTWSRCGQNRRNQEPLRGQECEPKLWTYVLSDGTERLATSQEQEEYEAILEIGNEFIFDQVTVIKKAFVSPDGTTASLENIDTDKYKGFIAPVQVIWTPKDGERVACDHPVCVGSFIEDVWIVEDKVIFLRRESKNGQENFGYNAFYSWNPSNNSVRQIKKNDGSYEGCSATSTALVCYNEHASVPRRIVEVNLTSGEDRILYDPAIGLADALTSRVDHLEISTDDGRFVHAKLVYPTEYIEGQRYPMVIVQGHYRGFLEGGSGNEYPVHLFAQEGFFVLNAAPYQQVSAFNTMTAEELNEFEFRNFRVRKNAVEAYSRHIDNIAAAGLIDPNRVAITGLSSGSANARYALIHSELFAAASLSTGYSGPQQYWSWPSQVRQMMRASFYEGALPFEETAETYMAHDQLGWHGTKIDFPPILWQVSDSELNHALFDFNLLYDEGEPVEMYVFPDALHFKHQPVHKLNVYRRNVQWMKFWLQGETVNNPVDPDQYERWAMLCDGYIDRVRETSPTTPTPICSAAP